MTHTTTSTIPPSADLVLQAAVRRTRAQLDAVGRISRSEALVGGDVERAALQITELAATVAGCERVSVWFFSEDEVELRCVDLFEWTPGRHSSGMVLHEQEFGAEFQAVKGARFVDADNPLTDPRTRGYAEGYLKPLGITSMLDAVIRASDRNYGLLCFEHVGTPHHWEEDEIAFACLLADQVGLALLNRVLRRTEVSAKATAAALADAQAVAHVGSWVLDLVTDTLTWSDENYKVFDVARDMAVPAYDAFLARVHPDDRDTVDRAYRASVADRTPYAVEHRVLTRDGRAKFVLERGRTFYDDRGRPLRTVGTSQDVTERRQALDSLQYRDALLHAVMTASAALVATAALDETVTTALKAIANALGVDRVALSRAPTGDALRPQLLYAWQAPGVPELTSDALGPTTVPDFQSWLTPLYEGRPVTIGRSTAAGTSANVMAAMNNQSLLLVPVVLDGVLWGVLSADDCHTEREWTPTETDALATLARVIVARLVRDAAHEALRRSEERFRAVAAAAQDAIITVDATGAVQFWNHAAERILGYTAAEAVGRQVHEWLAPSRFREAATAGMQAFGMTGGGPVLGTTLELTAVRKGGTEIPVELSVAPMEVGADRFAIGIMRDISDRKRAEAQILQLARTDTLTGLANRAVFTEAASQAMARARRSTTGFAVLYLDLDYFKEVNDTLGHPAGDLLLTMVAERIRSRLRDTDTAARFGGDEFAVLQADVADPTDVGVLASELLGALRDVFVIGGNEVYIGACIGIALYARETLDVEGLLGHADVALYRAKAEGRGTYRFFTETMDADVRARMAIAGELRAALAGNQLFLAYQPLVETVSRRIVGVEALVRWRHPDKGVLQPGDFMPAAETAGLAGPLGHWVLWEACRQGKAWLDAGLAPESVSINLSALQLKAPLPLDSDVAAALAATGFPPERLELELTEGALVDTAREHCDLLNRLRAHGVRLAIDDFGTGCMSLDTLREHPVDRIKIGPGLVGRLDTSRGHAASVRAGLAMARELGIRAVAEGVETSAQLDLLIGWGCRDAQGGFFAAPMEAEAVTALLRSGLVP